MRSDSRSKVHKDVRCRRTCPRRSYRSSYDPIVREAQTHTQGKVGEVTILFWGYGGRPYQGCAALDAPLMTSGRRLQ
jgi:hypothetical protein